jgi:hypothetical protein
MAKWMASGCAVIQAQFLFDRVILAESIICVMAGVW